MERDGDPISQYLFLLAAKELSYLLKGVDGMGGIKVAPSAPEVNLLLFVDDTDTCFLK